MDITDDEWHSVNVFSKSSRFSIPRWLAISVYLPLIVQADESLVSRFSGEWRDLQTEVAAINDRLAELPEIQFRDNGGTRCFMRFFQNTAVTPALDIDMTIRLQWPKARPVDLVALVPARKIDTHGLDPNHGFPVDFTVALITPDDTIKTIATYRSLSSHPTHHGHPIVMKMEEASLATGIEIHITRARSARHGVPNMGVVALSEILCFSGTENLATDARVSVDSNAALNPSSYWNDDLLIDGILPLGLPELPSKKEKPGESRAIGWTSKAHADPIKNLTITLDLGESRHIDGLRLFPALRPSVDDFPGYGIPLHFKLLGGNDPNGVGAKVLLDRSQNATSAHGHNFHYFRFPSAEVRYVKLDATHLWKPFEDYPAFLAFSEIELLDGNKVVSRGATVTVPEHNKTITAHEGQVWTPESLTDGRGPQGKLVSIRRWIELLDERLALETRRYRAHERMAQIERIWQRGILTTSVSTGALALMLILVQRIRHSRHLQETRRRIANDLHDDVGSNLGSIQVLSSLACDKANNHEELDTIRKVAAETITSVRDIVWLLQPASSEQISIVDHLRESAAALLDPLEWSLKSDFQDWQLSDQERRHLVLFFREALHNIRHAKASKVDIRLSHEQSQFVLTVRDNGCGLSQEQLVRPSTLRSLRQRAERINGVFDVKSSSGNGTTLILRFRPRKSDSAKKPIQNPL